MVRTLLMDNQALTMAGTRYLLEDEASFQVVGEVPDQGELFSCIQQTEPDVLVLDYLSLTGLAAARCQKLHESYPTLKLFILTADTHQDRMLSVLQTGVFAFLTKNCSKKEIIQAFRTVAVGQKFYCNRVLDLLTNSSVTFPNLRTTVTSLSARERQIIRYIAQERSTQDIADHLSLSPHTINAHRKRILKKVGVKSPVGLVVQAFQLGIIRSEKGQIIPGDEAF